MKTNLTNHIYVLLDRSGSMESMRADVIGGFNNLLAEQQADGPDARMTLVQFDSQDPHEILTDAVKIDRVRPLSEAAFVPRGGTPLLDATGRLITKASVREDQRKTLRKRPEIITVITITDGEENQSHEFSRADILRLVKDKEAKGWSFVFLGAGLDAYAEAGGMGYDPRSVQAFAPDGAGAGLAFRAVSAAMVDKRARVRRNEAFDAGDFFEGNKVAEDDRTRRRG
jgi:Mg-chelatase subunit ChlD